MEKPLIFGVMLLLLLGFSGQSTARVRVGVGIPLPPVVVFPAPPELVVIPGTYVYYSPAVDFDIFFYGGYWYRPYGGYWYRSADYGGPWVYIESAPPVLLGLPHDFRIITRGDRRIPYADFHRNWRAWERERYWEHNNWGRPEHGHYGMAPSYRDREREHGGYDGGARERGESHGGDRSHGGGGHEGHERR